MNVDLCNMLLESLSPFKASSSNDPVQAKLKARINWNHWKFCFLNMVKASGMTGEKELKALLLHCGGVELQKIFYDLPGAEMEDNPRALNEPYKVALEMLDDYFTPKWSMAFERHLFHKLRRNRREKFSSYVLRVEGQASYCNFGCLEAKQIAIMDKLLLDAPQNMIKREILLKKDMNSGDVFAYARYYEAIIKTRAQ
ncbi:uncharacterized protein LOC132264294 [Phlebotomus argentipes]|uniref:uncharacterized protein LOC132264294 n=1 Tax=Phlebotomus argentipes TaxID=94469 RepID=UPI0028936D39|nr:uncharacterized protein LOC132264294 [Phlebotomus argentipes]